MAKEKKPKSKARKIIEWSITGFFLAIIGVIAGVRIYQKVTNDYAVFGTQYPVVLTDSMEPDYMVNDVLVIKSVDPKEVAVGDDISFYWDLKDANGKTFTYMMTHRVKSVEYFEDTALNSGYHYTFETHGINKTSNQCSGDCTGQTQSFHENKFIGKVTGKSEFLRASYLVFKSPWTLIFLILVPSMYIILSSVISLFKTIKDDDEPISEAASPQSGGADPLAGLSSEDRERLKKEMLDELLNKNNREDKQ